MSMTTTHIDAVNTSTQSIINLSVDQAYYHMDSLLASHNVGLIIKVINQCMHQFTIELVEKIIKDERYFFSPEEKMNIIFGTASYCGAKKNMHHRLLDFLLEYPQLQLKTPILLVFMRSAYADSLPLFINWCKERQKTGNKKNMLSSFIEQACLVAIEQNDYRIIEKMFNKKIRISAAKASQLLWVAVEKNKSSNFVSILVKYGQADVNYVEQGKTLLMEAVEHNNKAMVQALLDEGAVVDHIVDPVQGTALQIALARKDNVTEMLLREYGG